MTQSSFKANWTRLRGAGHIGAELLKQVERDSKSKGLEVLRLCCVIQNESGMKFYRREGWKERAFALVKKLNP
jgi:hypothetical protein